MKSLGSWLITFFAVIFWLFRISVLLMESFKKEFVTTAVNYNLEVILLFVTLIVLVLVVKRFAIGAFLYLGMYGAYFGYDAYQKVLQILDTGNNVENIIQLAIPIIALILAISIFLDTLFNKNRTGRAKDAKTDWFYTNEQYDRKLDERADKNRYRIS